MTNQNNPILLEDARNSGEALLKALRRLYDQSE